MEPTSISTRTRTLDGRVAILTPTIAGGAFTNLSASLAKGFLAVGAKQVHILHLAGEPRQETSWPVQACFHSLGRKARASVPALIQFLRDVQPSFIISMPGYVNIPAILARLCLPRSSTKLIITEHAVMSHPCSTAARSELHWRFLPSISRVLYPKADGLVAVSDEVLDDLVHLGIRMPARRSTTIPNPVDIEAVRVKARMTPTHPWLRFKRQPVIVSVGRLALEKNQSLLLSAFSLLHKEIDVKLVIFGTGYLEGQLRNMIMENGLGEHADLAGWRDNPWCEVAQADLFVLPSDHEPFGLVLVEAMACGVPIVATDAVGGGPRFILDQGRSGMLVPKGDVNALASGMLEMLARPGQRQAMIAAGAQRTAAFHPAAIAERWVSFLSGLS